MKFFILPALGLVVEYLRWKHQDVTHRAIACCLLFIAVGLSLIWRETARTKHPGHHAHRRHRHRH